jgi:hypothetical protein
MCYADVCENLDGTFTATCYCGWCENHQTRDAAERAAQGHQNRQDEQPDDADEAWAWEALDPSR